MRPPRLQIQHCVSLGPTCNAAEYLRCHSAGLRRYALLLAIETDGHFDAVAKLLERRFPYATAKFVCNERKNVSPRAQKAQLRANQSSEAFADAMARMNAVDLALWRHVRDHPAVRV